MLCQLLERLLAGLSPRNVALGIQLDLQELRALIGLQIHWFSIINSCVTVLLLTGFLATILMRVLKKDFVKYTRDDEAGKAQKQ